MEISNVNKRDHGGNIHELMLKTGTGIKDEEILDFSANLNPLGFPDSIRPLVSFHLKNISHYPDQEYRILRKSISEKHEIPMEFIWPGNGASELIFHLPRVHAFNKCIIPIPCYTDYLYAAKSIGLSTTTLALSRESSFSPERKQIESVLDRSKNLLFIGQPSNPIGSIMKNQDIINLAENFPQTLFCIDESFADYIPHYVSLGLEQIPNIAVIRSMTKIYAIPGLRLGYVIAHPGIINKLRTLLPSWSVNSLAATLGPELLKETAYIEKTLEIIQHERKKLYDHLSKIQIYSPYPSKANFLTVEIKNKQIDADLLMKSLLKSRIAIRCLKHVPGLGNEFFRIAVRSAKENDLFLQAIDNIDFDSLISPESSHKKTIQEIKKRERRKAKKKKKALMILGTSSNAGKSIIATAFCRIFKNDGIKVAPFKAQNMSLNSFVTEDGCEMGRAQVLQAEACKLLPDVRMNPVLLKPSSDVGSQVILMGKPIGNMNACFYYQKKQLIWQDIRKAYDSLAGEYDLVVLEGAGSPAEINLKKNDIVNLNMAAYSDASTLLVGDIDRGGVYASFIGTMEVLTEAERNLISGYVINKFRGDPRLLKDAHDYMLKYTGKPVLGVVPMINALQLPEEDSVSFKDSFNSGLRESRDINNKLVIIVVDFPYISNFTDIDALKRENDVHIKIIRSAAEIPGHWDFFILPGSKNVIHDLRFLKTSGIAEYLIRISDRLPGELIGICGGFQMLGLMVLDPENIESNIKSEAGLSLLNMKTTIMEEKILRQTKALYLPTRTHITGYEIHHGDTIGDDLKILIEDSEDQIIGYSDQSGKIWGTYLHGIFDNDQWRRWLLGRYRKNNQNSVSGNFHFDLNREIDRLAEIVKKSINMEKIYQELGL